jgi:hypothetical protein
MATTLFDLILPEVATARVRTLPDEANYTLKQFMPERNINVIKAQLRIGVRNIKPAIYRSYDAETPVVARPGSLQQWDYMLPPLGGKIKLGEEDEQLLFLAGQASPAANAAVIQALYDDIDSLARMVHASMEIGRAQYMSSGVCTFPIEDGSNLSMDWAVPSGHKPTAATLWSDTANATPLTDEQAWIDTLIAEGVGTPSRAVTSTPVRRLLAANAQYKAALYGSVVPTGLTTLTPNQVDSVREIYGLPPLTVYDTIINGSRIFPTSKFTLVPGEGTVGETQFGTTSEARVLSGGTNPRIALNEAPGLIGLVQVDGDPPRKETKVAAIGAPIPSDPNRIFIATVNS